jgi:DUF917 family protein
MRQLTERSLETLALGAALLGTGGGGDPYIGKLMARKAIQENGPITVIEPKELQDTAICAMSAVMGAPTVLVEKLPGEGEQLAALTALEKHINGEVTHIICAEVGGMNSTLPIVTAARTGLPLVDCDAMGRAFPEIQMSTPTLSGIQASPIALADDKGNSVVIDAVDNHWTERLARSITIDMGAAAFIALFVQTGKQVKESMIPNSLLLAESIGRAIIEARAQHHDPVQAALIHLEGFRIFKGKITDVERRTVAGFARGRLTADGLDEDTGETLEIEFQNENLVAVVSGKTAATVPDLVAILDSQTGQPITTEELRYGLRVQVIAAPCHPKWRSPEGLALVGPRYFGYEIDYIPVEQLVSSRGRRHNE